MLLLKQGKHLDQKTFHARYAPMLENVWAELIEGVVYILPPRKGFVRPFESGTDSIARWPTSAGTSMALVPTRQSLTFSPSTFTKATTPTAIGNGLVMTTVPVASKGTLA
jgi:hypothetical protein